MSLILCSTGTFVGRVNGCNYKLITEYGNKLNCDGLEFIIYSRWYPYLDTIIHDILSSGLRFPSVHADKAIGGMISSLPDNDFSKCEDAWKVNLEAAKKLGAEKIVCHIWGVPDSDAYAERIYERTLRLEDTSREYGIDMVSENCCCVRQSPLYHFKKLLKLRPSLGFTIDTRPAQFHRELKDECAAPELWHGAVRHLHISDFHGGLKDWNALYPIPAPGTGDVDYPLYFEHLKKVKYDGTVTLESPSMQPDRVDYKTLNSYLDFIRNGLDSSDKI